MRWKIVVAGMVLATAATIGCQRQIFLHECDYAHYNEIGLPARLENEPASIIQPPTSTMPAPSTVLDPERKPRYLTLNEAIALALETGTVGSQSPTSPGLGSDSLVTSGIAGFGAGAGVGGGDSIRAFALDPAVAATTMEASLARFDAQWSSSMTWNTSDQPPIGTNLFNSGINTAAFTTGLFKPLPSGGVTGITFSTNYQFVNRSSPVNSFTTINPSYTPKLGLVFDQPLLRGAGVEINQLLSQFPADRNLPFQVPASGAPGILVSRLRFDQQRAEFQRNVHWMLLNVETAYWNLYGAYWTLYSQEQALRQAYEAWKINKARFEAGRIPMQDFAQTRQQYELFRGNRLQAVGQVLESERQLRSIVGLPGEDGSRLIPTDAPTLTPYTPDWTNSLNQALALRPELVLARQDLKGQQFNVITVKNLLLPDLRVLASYDITGVGTQLDGGANNAFRSLASDRFTDWSIGLNLTMPIGYREVHAQMRAARLNLARSYLTLQDQEKKAQRFLELEYRHLFEFYEQIQIQRSQRLAAALQLQARFTEFLAGRGTLDILLEAQRVWANALQQEYTFIVQYNNALAAFEFAKGTIMEHDNVVISEGPLPQCAQVRAAEHERQRSKGIVLRERANPIPGCNADFDKGDLGIANPPTDQAPAIPSVMNGTPIPEVADPIPGASRIPTTPGGTLPTLPGNELPPVLGNGEKGLRTLPAQTPVKKD